METLAYDHAEVCCQSARGMCSSEKLSNDTYEPKDVLTALYTSHRHLGGTWHSAPRKTLAPQSITLMQPLPLASARKPACAQKSSPYLPMSPLHMLSLPHRHHKVTTAIRYMQKRTSCLTHKGCLPSSSSTASKASARSSYAYMRKHMSAQH